MQRITSEFEWTKLTPSERLEWKPCYSEFQCSRLQVPLDYSAPHKSVATIAVVKYPSTSPKSQYRGPVLFNPGGPGASGVELIVETGAAFATVLGAQFDIVGFDPRGVSYSTPIISLFKTDAERSLWNAVAPQQPSLNSSDVAFQMQWARSHLLGSLAKKRDSAENLLLHMTTDNVARDMLRITEAFGFPKLQYYGISYGSVIGSTFATMFPDKIGRLVLDGVMNPTSWYAANLTNTMVDADKTLQTFFDGCAAAGPNACAFYAPTGVGIAAKLTALTTAIKNEPIPVITDVSYGIVDFVLLRTLLFQALYSPYTTFQTLAQGLALLAAGDASALYKATEVAPFECPKCGTKAPVFHQNRPEATRVFACGDGAVVNDSLSQFRHYYADQSRVTSFSDVIINWRMTCAGWKIHREGRFLGPFGAGKTSFPALGHWEYGRSSNPLTSAKTTASKFPGTVVLTQDSSGHTSITVQSSCTYLHVRKYF
ncbi:Alpha/Beta hydrolase protein [Mycena rebaudengoi]|nr:Alpha/Beta hydrolase protein [Mycena rebaudengoi]